MTPDEHAVVVPVDAAAVADAILRLLTDRDFAAGLTAAAHFLVERTRDRASETRRLVRLYETLAAR
jgi:glycosyltransferase involved in cell wall biosynthesis